MRIQPKTEADVSPLLKPGVYDFTVSQAFDKESKSGNDMIELHLEVFTETGSTRHLKDWLLEKVAYKLRHFFYAVGKGDLYESGEFTAADCIGTSGKVKLGVESQEGYQDKNAVRDYEAKADGAPVKVRAGLAADVDKLNASQAGGGSAAPLDEPPFARLGEFE